MHRSSQDVLRPVCAPQAAPAPLRQLRCAGIGAAASTLRGRERAGGRAGARAQALGAPGAVGSALLAQLLERHGGLPAGVEAGLALAAHACHEAAGAADAVAALVGFAARRVPAWAAAREWKPLARLVTGAAIG